MYCKKCGAKLGDDGLFCPRCGERISRDDAQDVSENAAPAEDKTEKDDGRLGSGKKRRRNKKKGRRAEEPPKEAASRVKAGEADKEAPARDKAGDDKKEAVSLAKPDKQASDISREAAKAEGEADRPEETKKGKKIKGEIVPASGGELIIESGEAEEKGRKKHGLLRKLPGLFVAVIIIALIAFGISFFTKKKPMFGNNSSQLLYLKDNEVMMYNGKESIVMGQDALYPWHIDDSPRISGLTSFSKNGELLYIPRDASAKSCDLFATPTGGDCSGANLVANDVTWYRELGDKLLYISDSFDRRLFISAPRGENREKVAGGVLDLTVTGDGKYIIYRTDDSNKLYCVDSSLKNERVKLDTGVTDYCVMPHSGIICYVRDGFLYQADTSGEKKKLDENVVGFYPLFWNEENEYLYYAKLNRMGEEIYSQLVDDEYAESDARLKKPDRDTYTNPLSGKPVSDSEYSEALEEYREKENRDILRKNLKGYINSMDVTALYCFDGHYPEKLSEAVSDHGYYFDPEDGYDENGCLFFKEVVTEGVRKIRLTELSGMSFDDIMDLRDTGFGLFGRNQLITAHGTTIFDSPKGQEPEFATALLDGSRNKAYLAFKDSQKHSLYSLDVTDGPGEVEFIGDDPGTPVLAGGRVYYTIGHKTMGGDLYVDGEKLDDKVLYAAETMDGSSAVYLKRTGQITSDLYSVIDSAPVKVGENIDSFQAFSPVDIVILKDYFSASGGKLCIFNGEELKTVDVGVWSIVKPTESGASSDIYMSRERTRE